MTNYEIICLDNNSKKDNALIFDLRIGIEWYRVAFKDGSIQDIKKSIYKGTQEQIERNKLDYWDVDDEIMDSINEIVLQWCKKNKIPIAKKDDSTDYLFGDVGTLDILKITKEKTMLEYLISLFLKQDNNTALQVLKTYIYKVNNMGIDACDVFNMIDIMIGANSFKAGEESSIMKRKLYYENKILVKIKTILSEAV